MKEQKIVYEQIEDLGNAKHIFSHLEWHMKGFLIICKKNENMNFIWANKKELKNTYSIPNAYVREAAAVIKYKICGQI